MRKPTAEEIAATKKVLTEKKVDFVLAQFVDIYGATKAKLVPVAHFEDVCTSGAGFAGFAASGMGVGPEAPDIVGYPDLHTLTILPWRKNVARFACNIWFDGKPSNYCSRTILQRATATLAEKGYKFETGVEPEFFLVRKTADGSVEIAEPKDTLAKPCYDMSGITRFLDFIQTVVQSEREIGFDVEAIDHEDANCQFESDFRYGEAVKTADSYAFLRYMLSNLAEQAGIIASFMPKPFSNLTGNGAHFHMNLADTKTGRNLFVNGEGRTDKRGLGYSELGYNFIGGLKKHAKAYIALTAPTVNSYKRLIFGAPVSGATWAPVYITYGGNNRTQMLRSPGPTRIEDRTVDSSCNVYLATAALIAAGMDGVEHKIDPGPKNEGNMYTLTEEQLEKDGIELLPTTLKEALFELEKDNVIKNAIGEEFIDYYIKFKLKEWKEYHDTVTKWELDKYLTMF